MTQDIGNERKKWYERFAAGYEASITDPELRRKLINNLSAALDSDEKCERFARNSGVNPEELKKLLKKPL